MGSKPNQALAFRVQFAAGQQPLATDWNPRLDVLGPADFPERGQGIGGVSNGLFFTCCCPTLDYRRVPLRIGGYRRARDSRQSSHVPTLQLLRAQLASFLIPTDRLDSSPRCPPIRTGEEFT